MKSLDAYQLQEIEGGWGSETVAGICAGIGIGGAIGWAIGLSNPFTAGQTAAIGVTCGVNAILLAL